MVHILVVDDDSDVPETIRAILEREGHDVSIAANGQIALDLLESTRYDLIVLDIIMPELSGIEVCRRIRGNPFTAKIPILFLTAKGRVSDIALGLDAGGDDYLVKPFDLVELPARIRALLRRAPGNALDPEGEFLLAGGLKLRVGQPEALIDSQAYSLTAIEHHLLFTLMSSAGYPVSNETLLQTVWGYPAGAGNPNVVQVAIKRLRDKLEPTPEAPQYILSVRGEGYMIPS